MAGIAVIIHRRLEKKTDNYNVWNESIIQTRIKTEWGYLSVLAVYAPKEGDEEGNELVYSRLQEITNKVQIPDYLVILGELNARVGIKKIQSAIGRLYFLNTSTHTPGHTGPVMGKLYLLQLVLLRRV